VPVFRILLGRARELFAGDPRGRWPPLHDEAGRFPFGALPIVFEEKRHAIDELCESGLILSQPGDESQDRPVFRIHRIEDYAELPFHFTEFIRHRTTRNGLMYAEC